MTAAADILQELERLLRARREHPPPGSYSARLVSDSERAARKIMEEAFEFSVELLRAPVAPERTVAEAADLLFHVLAGLVASDTPLNAVLAELGARRGER